MGEGGYETHGESGGHDRSSIHNPSVEEMGRRKGGRTRKERKRAKTSYRRLHKLPTVTTSYRRLHKLPTVKLLACIHDMQKGDGGRAGTSGGEGGQGRVVSGKGQILTTYRGPSSREREGGGDPPGETGETPTQPGGGGGHAMA